MIEAKQIDWSLVPDWAEYVAMDEDGQAWAYAQQPSAPMFLREWDGLRCDPVDELNDYIDRSQWRSSLARRPAKTGKGGGDSRYSYSATVPAREFDNVSRPSHYVIKDGVEVIDVREWWLANAKDSEFGMVMVSHLERAMEYLLRAPGKNGMEDVRKAYQYLHRALHGEWPK